MKKNNFLICIFLIFITSNISCFHPTGYGPGLPGAINSFSIKNLHSGPIVFSLSKNGNDWDTYKIGAGGSEMFTDYNYFKIVTKTHQKQIKSVYNVRPQKRYKVFWKDSKWDLAETWR